MARGLTRQLVTATTVVQRLSRCTGADFTAASKTDGPLKCGFSGYFQFLCGCSKEDALVF